MRVLILLITTAALSGCAISKEQLEALGPGDKVVCFHARQGVLWSTTTVAASATDGKVPTVSETCELNPKK